MNMRLCEQKLEIASQKMDIEAKRSMEPMKVVQAQQIAVQRQ